MKERYDCPVKPTSSTKGCGGKKEGKLGMGMPGENGNVLQDRECKLTNSTTMKGDHDGNVKWEQEQEWKQK